MCDISSVRDAPTFTRRKRRWRYSMSLVCFFLYGCVVRSSHESAGGSEKKTNSSVAESLTAVPNNQAGDTGSHSHGMKGEEGMHLLDKAFRSFSMYCVEKDDCAKCAESFADEVHVVRRAVFFTPKNADSETEAGQEKNQEKEVGKDDEGKEKKEEVYDGLWNAGKDVVDSFAGNVKPTLKQMCEYFQENLKKTGNKQIMMPNYSATTDKKNEENHASEGLFVSSLYVLNRHANKRIHHHHTNHGKQRLHSSSSESPSLFDEKNGPTQAEVMLALAEYVKDRHRASAYRQQLNALEVTMRGIDRAQETEKQGEQTTIAKNIKTNNQGEEKGTGETTKADEHDQQKDTAETTNKQNEHDEEKDTAETTNKQNEQDEEKGIAETTKADEHDQQNGPAETTNKQDEHKTSGEECSSGDCITKDSDKTTKQKDSTHSNINSIFKRIPVVPNPEREAAINAKYEKMNGKINDAYKNEYAGKGINSVDNQMKIQKSFAKAFTRNLTTDDAIQQAKVTENYAKMYGDINSPSKKDMADIRNKYESLSEMYENTKKKMKKNLDGFEDQILQITEIAILLKVNEEGKITHMETFQEGDKVDEPEEPLEKSLEESVAEVKDKLMEAAKILYGDAEHKGLIKDIADRTREGASESMQRYAAHLKQIYRDEKSKLYRIIEILKEEKHGNSGNSADTGIPAGGYDKGIPLNEEKLISTDVYADDDDDDIHQDEMINTEFPGDNANDVKSLRRLLRQIKRQLAKMAKKHTLHKAEKRSENNSKKEEEQQQPDERNRQTTNIGVDALQLYMGGNCSSLETLLDDEFEGKITNALLNRRNDEDEGGELNGGETFLMNKFDLISNCKKQGKYNIETQRHKKTSDSVPSTDSGNSKNEIVEYRPSTNVIEDNGSAAVKKEDNNSSAENGEKESSKTNMTNNYEHYIPSSVAPPVTGGRADNEEANAKNKKHSKRRGGEHHRHGKNNDKKNNEDVIEKAVSGGRDYSQFIPTTYSKPSRRHLTAAVETNYAVSSVEAGPLVTAQMYFYNHEDGKDRNKINIESHRAVNSSMALMTYTDLSKGAVEHNKQNQSQGSSWSLHGDSLPQVVLGYFNVNSKTNKLVKMTVLVAADHTTSSSQYFQFLAKPPIYPVPLSPISLWAAVPSLLLLAAAVLVFLQTNKRRQLGASPLAEGGGDDVMYCLHGGVVVEESRDKGWREKWDAVAKTLKQTVEGMKVMRFYGFNGHPEGLHGWAPVGSGGGRAMMSYGLNKAQPMGEPAREVCIGYTPPQLIESIQCSTSKRMNKRRAGSIDDTYSTASTAALLSNDDSTYWGNCQKPVVCMDVYQQLKEEEPTTR